MRTRRRESHDVVVARDSLSWALMTTTTTSTKPVTEANAPERGTLHERTSHALTALTALRDHLRVQIHLGGMDARAT